jgi:hypothetical protein
MAQKLFRTRMTEMIGMHAPLGKGLLPMQGVAAQGLTNCYGRVPFGCKSPNSHNAEY